MTGHTPGPWALIEAPSLGWDVESNLFGRVGTIGLLADARLIAAAPEMYAFLKNVIPKGSVYEPEIEALIAKAEGREQP